MPDEKLNDINDVHAPRRGYHSAHHPSVISGCWCGATTGPLRWDGRLWCDDCLPLAGKGSAVRESEPVMCWCGNEPMHRKGPACHESSGQDGTPTHPQPRTCDTCPRAAELVWRGSLRCRDCVPDGLPVSAPGSDLYQLDSQVAHERLALASLARIESLLERLLSASIARASGQADPAAPAAPMPLQPGDRASYNGRRGVLRSIGVAGTGILYDDGRYALLTNAMAAKLVRE